jgi:YVTN family beta-propeller protein
MTIFARYTFALAVCCTTGCLQPLVLNPPPPTDSPDLGDPPSGLPPSTTPIPAVTGDALYVVNGADATISVIDQKTAAVVGTITMKDAKYPHHIYLSADAAKLVVAVPGVDLSGGPDSITGDAHGAVLLLDAATGTTLASRPLDGINHNAVFSPDGTEVWTSQMTSPGTVLVLDAETLAIKSTITVGDTPAEVTFSHDGKQVFVANVKSNSVSVIDPSTKAVTATISVGKEPTAPWPGGDGVMYTGCALGESIWAIDPASKTVLRTYTLGFHPGQAATPPSAATELWITDGDNGKVVFNSTSADQKSGDLATGAGAHGLAFSGDGKTAYVANQGAGTVSVIDVATHALKTSVTVGQKPNGVVFRAAPTVTPPGTGNGDVPFGGVCSSDADCISHTCQPIQVTPTIVKNLCTRSCTHIGQADPLCPGPGGVGLGGVCNSKGYCQP